MTNINKDIKILRKGDILEVKKNEHFLYCTHQQMRHGWIKKISNFEFYINSPNCNARVKLKLKTNNSKAQNTVSKICEWFLNVQNMFTWNTREEEERTEFKKYLK